MATDLSASNAPSRLRNIAGAAVLAATGILLLSACSSGSKTAATSPTPAAGRPSAGTNGARPGGPAATGVAAAITGNTIEVQNATTGQVSVTFSASTRFTQARAVSLATVVVGDCVTALAPATGSSASISPVTSFTATTIAVNAPVNGTCAAGGGFGRNRPSGAPSAAPSGAPSGAATGSRARFAGTVASGKVLRVAADMLTVQTTNRATGASTTDTVTATGTTVVTTTAAATSAALKVGDCVSANGTTSSTGAVTATRIALTTPTANGCSTGFGGRFGGGTGGSNG